jgi:2-C-methyl-D-erythritol 4-phosphate cytidylyltransferase
VRVTAIIVGAGQGRRVGANRPKAFLPLGGKPILSHVLERFAASKTVNEAVLVVPAAERKAAESLIGAEPAARRLACRVVSGGATRQRSVACGLAALGGEEEIVVVHDAARPLVKPSLIDACVEAAALEGGAIAALPAGETIKEVSGRIVVRTLARDALWIAQTPQAFRAELLRRAHRAANDRQDASDDAALVEAIGATVVAIEGDPTNLKITTPVDLSVAEWLLREGRAGF